MFNVNREINDTFYRYKMPKMTTKIEGKGNGIKTVLVNMPDVAKSLYRRPSYVTKYFGSELGTQTLIDEKIPRFVVNGAHDSNKLQDMLDGFIKKFVLCSSCANPETSLTVKKKTGYVNSKCKACGHIDVLDPKHKITTYIIRNPPTAGDLNSGEIKVTKEKNGEDESVIGDAEQDTDNVSPRGGDSESEEVWDNDDEDFLPAETTSKKEKKHLHPTIEKTSTERVDEFYYLVKDLFKSNQVVNSKNIIRDSADELKLGPGCVMVLVEILLANPVTILDDIKTYRTTFLIFTRKGLDQEQTKCQRCLISGIEMTIKRFEKQLLPSAVKIMKQLYDCDILTEDVIIEWHSTAMSKKNKKIDAALLDQIVKMCNPMIQWLQNASEEEDSDEDESVEENGDDKIDSQIKNLNLNGGTNKKVFTEIPDDEIDIDDI